jgi:hypothetical protein
VNPASSRSQLVFDISREWYRGWWFPAFGLVFVAGSLTFLLYARRPRTPPLAHGLLVAAWTALAFATAWTAVFGFATSREYVTLVRAVNSGAVQFVAGPVEHFVPMPVNGHGVEQFEVQGKHFEYSDNVVTAGFNTTSTRGGPIREGVHVRIGYVGATIVRLELL